MREMILSIDVDTMLAEQEKAAEEAEVQVLVGNDLTRSLVFQDLRDPQKIRDDAPPLRIPTKEEVRLLRHMELLAAARKKKQQDTMDCSDPMTPAGGQENQSTSGADSLDPKKEVNHKHMIKISTRMLIYLSFFYHFCVGFHAFAKEISKTETSPKLNC